MNILEIWNKISPLPFGSRIFSFVLGRMVPYTATICPHILSMEAGSVRVQMKDKRRVRNHLKSIHAIALMNLGEVTSGLAVLSGVPKGMRSIITHLEIDFIKKARGTLTAKAAFKLPPGDTGLERKSYDVKAQIENEEGEIVAEVKAVWLVGPDKS